MRAFRPIHSPPSRTVGKKLLEIRAFRGVANATAGIDALRHDPLKLGAQGGLERRFRRGTRDDQLHRNSFPYVLVCSTFATIVSLASVWLATAQSFSPVLGA